MHHRAASEVEAWKLAARSIQQAALAPHHVGHRVIDHDRPQHGEQHHRAELHALRERARDQSRRDDGEHHLVDHVRLRGKSRVGEVGRGADSMQEEMVQTAEKARPRVERKAVTEQQPRSPR